MKPREWWIGTRPEDLIYSEVFVSNKNPRSMISEDDWMGMANRDYFHVIDYLAYDTERSNREAITANRDRLAEERMNLAKQNKIMREALKSINVDSIKYADEIAAKALAKCGDFPD